MRTKTRRPPNSEVKRIDGRMLSIRGNEIDPPTVESNRTTEHTLRHREHNDG
jgi:hypothetical protein